MNADTVENAAATVEAAFVQQALKDADVKLMMGAIARHGTRMCNWDSLTIYPSDRTKDGWLEWLLHYEFTSGGKLTVGVIQRRHGEPIETHT